MLAPDRLRGIRCIETNNLSEMCYPLVDGAREGRRLRFWERGRNWKVPKQTHFMPEFTGFFPVRSPYRSHAGKPHRSVPGSKTAIHRDINEATVMVRRSKTNPLNPYSMRPFAYSSPLAALAIG